MDSFTESPSQPPRGLFFNHYKEAKSLRRDVSIILLILTLLFLFFWIPADKNLNSFLCLFFFCMFVLTAFLFHSYLFEIVGKDGGITVIDRNIILWPGQAIRLFSYPHFTHTVRFDGSLGVVCYIDNLEKFHDLEDYMFDVDLSAPHIKCLKVMATIDWRIGTERGLPATEALRVNQLSDAMKNQFNLAVQDAIRRMCNTHWEPMYPPTLQLFSKRVHERAQMGLKLIETKGGPDPLVHMDIAGFIIEVVDKTGQANPHS